MLSSEFLKCITGFQQFDDNMSRCSFLSLAFSELPVMYMICTKFRRKMDIIFQSVGPAVFIPSFWNSEKKMYYFMLLHWLLKLFSLCLSLKKIFALEDG
jgi:hypothetical protein